RCRSHRAGWAYARRRRRRCSRRSACPPCWQSRRASCSRSWSSAAGSWVARSRCCSAGWTADRDARRSRCARPSRSSHRAHADVMSSTLEATRPSAARRGGVHASPRAGRVRALLRDRVAVKLFFTVWLVYTIHFATDVARETYLALSLGERASIRVDEYLGLHPALV